MAPMAGQKGVADTSKMPKSINQSITQNTSIQKSRPFDSKAQDVQSIGILKNGTKQASDFETEMSLLLGKNPNQNKVQDDVTNNWRKKKERMQLYYLQKQFSVQEIKQEWVKNLIHWKKGDQKGDKKTLYLKQITGKNDLILHVTEQSRLEMLENYEDRWPLLNFRKSLQRMRIKINQFAYIILKHKAFENACLLIIGVNCYCLATDDPTAEFQTMSQVRFDKAFLALYSTEMIIKIVALGFILNSGSYLRDPWNVLDFIIVGSAWLTEIQTLIGGSSNNSLGALRAFRVLRPLKAVTSIKGLQVLVVAVLKSIPLLKDTFMILIFFFLIFAIAGLQLFAGLTKQTCVVIETGAINMDFYLDTANQGLCGGANYCPENNFCGQIMANPDYGTTNFDNILWGLLQVFVSITLEGWSEFMVKYQKTYTWLVGPLFFIPMSYLGGFFLLNLLLAVINSSFSSSNAVLQAKLKAEIEKNKKRKKPVKDDDWKDVTDGEPIMEIGTTEFFIAKRAAKKMIERLRTYQATKIAEAAYLKEHPPVFEDEEEAPAAQLHVSEKASEKVSPQIDQRNSPQLGKEGQMPVALKTSSSDDILDDDSDESVEHAKQVTDFLAQLDREERLEREQKGKKQIKIVTPAQPQPRLGAFDMRVAKQKAEGVKQITKIRVTTGDKPEIMDERKENANDNTNLDDLLDINKLLAEAEGSELSKDNPYDLSFIHSDQNEMPNFSDDDAKPTKKQQLRKDRKLKDADADSAIQSDSSLGETIDQLKKQSIQKAAAQGAPVNPVRSAIMNEIKRRMKQFRTQEKFEKEKSLMNETGQSTANPAHTTARHEDKDFKSTAPGDSQKDGKKLSIVGEGYEAKKKAFLHVISDIQQSFLTQQKPKNPYDYIDKKLQKIQINPGMPYLGTSVDDILEIRNLVNEAKDLEEENKFLQASYFLKQGGVEGNLNDDEDDDPYIKPQNDPYQLKTVYGITQDEEFNPYSDDEEAVQLELQPFDTATSIGYQHLLSHKPIQFRTRRSDIIVSSTLQITLAPADGDYVPLDQALLTQEQIQAWCHKRHEFRALNVENASYQYSEKKVSYKLDAGTILKQITMQREKASMIPSEIKVDGEEDKFGAQVQKKAGIIPPTLLQKPLPPEKIALLTEEEKRLYTIQKNKYDGFQRQVKKMDVKPWEIQFTLEDAKLLSEGKYHEEIAEEEAEDELDKGPSTVYFGREENFYDQNLKNFEKTYREQFDQQPRFKSLFLNKPYLPQDLQKELNLPENLEENQINYNEILKKDCQRKRKTPMWSGQEVLEIGLNEELSSLAVSQINAVRVWPKGFFGWVKKFRVFLKMIIKADWFNNCLMLAVLINTVIMSLASYGITADFSAKLDSANLFFTWFFICEMTIKLTAIGVKKYLADKMNWLDGGIVSLSVMEMVLTAVSGGGGNLSAFKTIRVLRTLRVLRVARLLRGMQSMQVIIAVFIRSATSFMYITMLLFVFLFIYTLLGMQQFGNCLNYVTGKPRDNYDTFLVAFYSSFQVMSSENWNGNVVDYMRSPKVPMVVTPLYLISWIFIGNYVLLNLFLAILLDSFLEEDGEEGVDLDEMARLAELKRQECVEKEKIRRLKKLGASIVRKQNQNDKNKKRLPLVEALVDDVDDMEHKLIREIFIDEGLIKKKDPEREKANMFSGVHAEKALYLFTKQNCLRIYTYKMISNKLFDNIIMLVIALSSAKLAIATYEKYLPKDSPLITLSENFDITLNVIFLFECISKNIALGFVMEEGSYLRESWNQLDFFIVCSSLMDMLLANVDIPAIKILRLLRTLRPLRVISHNRSMKLIVSALFESAGAIANVVIVVVACWLMFGIFGMNLFAGKFYYCLKDGVTDYTLLTMYACENEQGNWLPWMENFDNILQAMLVLFCESSSESWPDVMYRAMDASAVDYGPVVESQKMNGGFFILFMLIGNFFLMNFFVGVLFLKYEQASRRERAGYTTEQLAWLDIQGMIIKSTVPHEMQYKPLKSQVFRSYCWTIVNSTKFDIFIMAVIILNIGQMALYHLTAPLQFIKILEFTNYIFTAIFILEATLKILTYRLAYFKTGWNKFDFFVCCSSILDILMSQMSSTSLQALKAAPQLARILRVLRVTRIIKLAGKNEGLQALLATIQLAIGPIMNVFALLVLVLFIFSVLGNFMLGGIDPSFEGMAFYEYKNFANFHLAFQTMFVITTGESWNYYMYDSWTWGVYCDPNFNCGSILSPVYFVAFVMIVQFIMINLFALVVIDQFEMYYMSDDNPIEKFKRTYDVFLLQWMQMTMKYRGVKMREKQLFDFFRKLKVPIGLPEETTDNTIKKIVLKMGIRSDGGYIYFNEMLYRCMRRQFGNFRLGKRLQIAELLTQYKVYSLTLKAQNQEKKAKDHEMFFDKMIGSGKSVNPFLQMMYYRISFMTWRNYAEKLHRQKKHEEKQLKKKAKLESQGRTFMPLLFEDEKRKVQHIIVEVEEELLLTSEEEPEDENQSQLANEKNSFRRKPTSIGERQKLQRERYSTMKDKEASQSKSRLQVEASASKLDKKTSEKQSNQVSSRRSEASAAKK